MLIKRNYKTAGAVLIAALATGYAMQNGDVFASLFSKSSETAQLVQPVEEIQLVSSDIQTTQTGVALGLPRPPASALQPTSFPSDIKELANRVNQSEQDYVAPDLTSEQLYSPFGLVCDVTLSASKAAGAMAMLDLKAPCHADESVTVYHEGLEFTVVTSGVGQFSVSVPALTENAIFEVELLDGKTVTAEVDVPEMARYDRVAVQWVGESGLKIHALELGAEYGSSGHVWADAPQSVAQALQARGGYITKLGDANTPDANHAEVYSFPTGQINRNGVVRLSVEAEVTAYSCGKEVKAQALQNGFDGTVSVVDLTLSMPGCDAIGDFLVLKNLLRDLKIAQN